MADTDLNTLKRILWPEAAEQTGSQAYWLLDGARDPGIANLVMGSGLDYACLFSGPLHPRLEAAAPYLVRLEPDVPATGRLLLQGWGKAWGVFALAAPDVELSQLRLHFKKFLRVKTEEGKELAFRFYDPRVLTVYLPTCTASEYTTFLGPLSCLLAETDHGNAMRSFTLAGDSVEVQDRPVPSVRTSTGRF